jgi:lysophospholipase L1-like esterase
VKCIGEESAGVKRVRELAAQGHFPGTDFVIVLAGVNDLASGRSVSTVTSGLTQIYDMAHSVGATVIAVTLTPWLGHSKGGKLSQETHEVNTWIRNQSSADIVVESSTLGHAGYLIPSYNAGDGLHLNQTGQQALADTVMHQSFGIVA